MPHFFVPAEQISPPFVEISGNAFHHLYSVLRIKAGEKIRIFNGQGETYQIIVEKIEKNSLKGKILHRFTEQPAPFSIHLFSGVIKGSKMEFLLEKTTEVGVREITPLITRRTIVKIKDASSKINRWQKIVLMASEQSEQVFLPKVDPPTTFPEALKKISPTDFNILAWEEEKTKTLRQAIAPLPSAGEGNINIFIGPEGGFAPEEVALARRAGCQIVTLGKNILKAETAATLLVFLISYELRLV